MKPQWSGAVAVLLTLAAGAQAPSGTTSVGKGAAASAVSASVAAPPAAAVLDTTSGSIRAAAPGEAGVAVNPPTPATVKAIATPTPAVIRAVERSLAGSGPVELASRGVNLVTTATASDRAAVAVAVLEATAYYQPATMSSVVRRLVAVDASIAPSVAATAIRLQPGQREQLLQSALNQAAGQSDAIYAAVGAVNRVPVGATAGGASRPGAEVPPNQLVDASRPNVPPSPPNPRPGKGKGNYERP